MKLIFNIWWLYISLVSVNVIDTFEVIAITENSNSSNPYNPIIVIWEYG